MADGKRPYPAGAWWTWPRVWFGANFQTPQQLWWEQPVFWPAVPPSVWLTSSAKKEADSLRVWNLQQWPQASPPPPWLSSGWFNDLSSQLKGTSSQSLPWIYTSGWQPIPNALSKKLWMDKFLEKVFASDVTQWYGEWEKNKQTPIDTIFKTLGTGIALGKEWRDLAVRVYDNEISKGKTVEDLLRDQTFDPVTLSVVKARSDFNKTKFDATCELSRIVDWDTVLCNFTEWEMNIERAIRFLGINTPESVGRYKNNPQEYWVEASNFLSTLIRPWDKLFLSLDKFNKGETYWRPLYWIDWVDWVSTKDSPLNVHELLVLNWLAEVTNFKIEPERQKRLLALREEAKKRGIGIRSSDSIGSTIKNWWLRQHWVVSYEDRRQYELEKREYKKKTGEEKYEDYKKSTPYLPFGEREDILNKYRNNAIGWMEEIDPQEDSIWRTVWDTAKELPWMLKGWNERRKEERDELYKEAGVYDNEFRKLVVTTFDMPRKMLLTVDYAGKVITKYWMEITTAAARFWAKMAMELELSAMYSWLDVAALSGWESLVKKETKWDEEWIKMMMDREKEIRERWDRVDKKIYNAVRDEINYIKDYLWETALWTWTETIVHMGMAALVITRVAKTDTFMKLGKGYLPITAAGVVEGVIDAGIQELNVEDPTMRWFLTGAAFQTSFGLIGDLALPFAKTALKKWWKWWLSSAQLESLDYTAKDISDKTLLTIMADLSTDDWAKINKVAGEWGDIRQVEVLPWSIAYNGGKPLLFGDYLQKRLNDVFDKTMYKVLKGDGGYGAKIDFNNDTKASFFLENTRDVGSYIITNNLDWSIQIKIDEASIGKWQIEWTAKNLDNHFDRLKDDIKFKIEENEGWGFTAKPVVPDKLSKESKWNISIRQEGSRTTTTLRSTFIPWLENVDLDKVKSSVLHLTKNLRRVKDTKKDIEWQGKQYIWLNIKQAALKKESGIDSFVDKIVKNLESSGSKTLEIRGDLWLSKDIQIKAGGQQIAPWREWKISPASIKDESARLLINNLLKKGKDISIIGLPKSPWTFFDVYEGTYKKQANQFDLDDLAWVIIENIQKRYPLEKIVTSGKAGLQEAFAKAAAFYWIKSEIIVPKGKSLSEVKSRVYWDFFDSKKRKDLLEDRQMTKTMVDETGFNQSRYSSRELDFLRKERASFYPKDSLLEPHTLYSKAEIKNWLKFSISHWEKALINKDGSIRIVPEGSLYKREDIKKLLSNRLGTDDFSMWKGGREITLNQRIDPEFLGEIIFNTLWWERSAFFVAMLELSKIWVENKNHTANLGKKIEIVEDLEKKDSWVVKDDLKDVINKWYEKKKSEDRVREIMDKKIRQSAALDRALSWMGRTRFGSLLWFNKIADWRRFEIHDRQIAAKYLDDLFALSWDVAFWSFFDKMKQYITKGTWKARPWVINKNVIVNTLSEGKIDIEDAGLYAIYKRILSMKDIIVSDTVTGTKRKLYSDKDITLINKKLAELEWKYTSEQLKLLKESTEELRGLYRETLDYMYANKYISKVDWERLTKNKEYVPFIKEVEIESWDIFGSIEGKDLIKSLKGWVLWINNPYFIFDVHVQKIASLVEKNNAYRVVFDNYNKYMTREFGDWDNMKEAPEWINSTADLTQRQREDGFRVIRAPKSWAEKPKKLTKIVQTHNKNTLEIIDNKLELVEGHLDSKGVVRFRDSGQVFGIKFKDQMLFKVATDDWAAPSWWKVPFQAFTNLRYAVATGTFAPYFRYVTNAIKDYQHWMHLYEWFGVTPYTRKEWFEARRAIIEWLSTSRNKSVLAQEYLQAVSEWAFFTTYTAPEFKKRIDPTTMNIIKINNSKYKFFKKTRQISDYLERTANANEEVTRFLLRKKLKEAGVGEFDRVMWARKIGWDYASGGRLFKEANTMIAYLNSTYISVANTLQIIAANPKAFGKKLLTWTILPQTAVSVWNSQFQDDEARRVLDKIPPHIQKHWMPIIIPTWDWTYHFIPMYRPWIMWAVWYVAGKVIDKNFSWETWKYADLLDIMDMSFSHFNPFGATNSFIPDLASDYLWHVKNKTWYNKDIIPEYIKDKGVSPYLQHTNNTREVYKFLAKSIYDLTEWTMFEWFQFSPIWAEYHVWHTFWQAAKIGHELYDVFEGMFTDWKKWLERFRWFNPKKMPWIALFWRDMSKMDKEITSDMRETERIVEKRLREFNNKAEIKSKEIGYWANWVLEIKRMEDWERKKEATEIISQKIAEADPTGRLSRDVLQRARNIEKWFDSLEFDIQNTTIEQKAIIVLDMIKSVWTKWWLTNEKVLSDMLEWWVERNIINQKVLDKVNDMLLEFNQ